MTTLILVSVFAPLIPFIFRIPGSIKCWRPNFNIFPLPLFGNKQIDSLPNSVDLLHRKGLFHFSAKLPILTS